MTTVAFLTPNFNRHDLFPATLASMQSQTLTDWECWLVDDGSDPENYDAIVALCADEPRVRVSRRDRGPKGACTCRNNGATNTKAKYVISLDTDDITNRFAVSDASIKKLSTDQRLRQPETVSPCFQMKDLRFVLAAIKN